MNLATKSSGDDGAAIQSEKSVSEHSGTTLSGRRRQFNSALGIGIDAPATNFGAGSNGAWGGGQFNRPPWDRYGNDESEDDASDDYWVRHRKKTR